MTKLSPAFTPAFSAASNTRASAGLEINLAGAAAGHFRNFGERCFGRLQGQAGLAAGTVDQAGRQPFRVVEQDFEQMLGGKLLVALTQGQRLRGLDKTPRPVGIFLEIHVSTPSAHDGTASNQAPVGGLHGCYVGVLLPV